jgi:hypothetical protein
VKDIYQIKLYKNSAESNISKITSSLKNADLIVLSANFTNCLFEILSIVEDKLNVDAKICFWDRSIQLQINQLNESYEFSIIVRKKVYGLYPLDLAIITNLKRKNV